MTLMEFLSDRLEHLVLQTVFAASTALFLLLTGTQAGIVILLGIGWFAVSLCMLGAEFWRCRSRLKELESIMEGLDKKYIFSECIPKPRNNYERRLQDLMKRAGRDMISAVSDAQAAQQEYREYVESWVHEVKAPITAAGLICNSVDRETRRKLLKELAQIEAHVERALFYARAESPEKDFIVRATSLASIVIQAIDNHRSLLMQNNVRVDTEDLEQPVYTDEKWTVFILGQLLQNAVRYRSEDPVILISGRCLGKRVQLTVCDNGIGIYPHELPRIFDKGFTGSNGRTRGGATGMGLYLSRRLAECLEIDLQITSEASKGTRITLTFPAKDNLTIL